MDEFFQNLREIQKKERSLSSLSPVGQDFYQQISSYFNRLMERIDNNPFSFESYLLRDAQRIVVEICERREYKITNSAVMNAQRTYHLFKNSREDGRPKIPSNSTPEEEKLYLEIYQSLTAYREEMRSPLISYSHKKDIKLNSLSSLKRTSKPVEEGQVEDEVKVNSVDRDITEQNIGVTESFNETSISKKRRNNSVRTNPAVDEIPPEIQDEIYRQFGREPSKQDSKKSTNVSSGEIKPGTLKDSSDTHNNSKNEFKEDTVHSVDPVVLKDTPGLHKMSTEILMILDELPSIMGVDSKVYGPFHPGDIIAMPEPNARILIKNHKGKSIQRYK